jgi:hypothetical protein
MCTDDQKFTTIVGPRRSVEQLVEIFPKTAVAARHDLTSPPQFIDLAQISSAFFDPESPAVAVIHHGRSKGFPVAAELQTELLIGDRYHGIHPLRDLLCEPGYLFRGAAVASGPAVALDPNGITRLRSSAPRVPSGGQADGTRVALLDTGAQSTSNTMVDFTSVPPVPTTSADDNGHGTAVAQIISTLSPGADIYPVRVLGPAGNTGPSYQVLAGLAYTLWSGLFDIVNASLTSTTSAPCDHSFGSSVGYVVQTCRNQNPRMPLIVAAAGNDRTKKSGYPALVPGAIVAMALEQDPATVGGFKRASYNSTPPQPAKEEEAFGGSETDPIGTVLVNNGPSEPLYGTSFAAAAITAAYLP